MSKRPLATSGAVVPTAGKNKRTKTEFVLSAESNSGRMHERNIYNGNEPDYKKLAEKFDFLKEYVKLKNGRGTIDFADPNAMVALTKALLKRDFKLDWEIPVTRLCPPVPNRLNYILWIQDLIKLNAGNEKNIKGLDIGTGASCIYPLLGISNDESWNFIATDIDEESVKIAKKIVEDNKLNDRIDIRHVNREVRIKGALKNSDGKLDFCMCNPPFFASALEIKNNPAAKCMGTKDEIICEGGEEKFVGDIVKDSLELKDRVRWYTSMLGKKSSVKAILRRLREAGVKNVVTTDFLQGRTSRWGIGWCFEPERVQDSALRLKVAMGKQKAKKIRERNTSAPGSTFTVARDRKTGESVVAPRFEEVLKAWKERGVSVKGQSVGDGTASVSLEHGKDEVREMSVDIHWEKSQNTSGVAEDLVAVTLNTPHPDGTTKQEFLRICDQIKADVQRTNRKWRRIMKKAQQKQ